MFFVQNVILAVVDLLAIVLNLYFWVVIVAAVLSWVRPDPYNPVVRALRTLTETLRLTGALPGVFRCHLQADFSRSGTEALLEGIVGLRLGSLIPTIALMGSVYLRSRRQYASGERPAAAV